MALPPLKLADVNVGSALTENWGRPTSYFQRYLQDNNNRITASISGIAEVQAELVVQQAELTAQQATLTAQQATLTAQQATLTAQQVQLTSTDAALLRLSRAAEGVGPSLDQFTTTDGSGIVTIVHGYSLALAAFYPPLLKYCTVFPTGGPPLPIYHIQLKDVDNFELRFQCFDFTGAPLASTGVSFVWHVAGA